MTLVISLRHNNLREHKPSNHSGMLTHRYSYKHTINSFTFVLWFSDNGKQWLSNQEEGNCTSQTTAGMLSDIHGECGSQGATRQMSTRDGQDISPQKTLVTQMSRKVGSRNPEVMTEGQNKNLLILQPCRWHSHFIGLAHGSDEPILQFLNAVNGA